MHYTRSVSKYSDDIQKAMMDAAAAKAEALSVKELILVRLQMLTTSLHRLEDAVASARKEREEDVKSMNEKMDALVAAIEDAREREDGYRIKVLVGAVVMLLGWVVTLGGWVLSLLHH